jgi:hypothetical protein
MKYAFKYTIENPENKTTLARLRHRWIGNIKMTAKETEHETAEWILLTQH